jgi:hypothetical protein
MKVFLSLDEGALNVNLDQILYVQCRPMTKEEDSEGWYEHKIYFAGKDAPLVCMSQKWFTDEVEHEFAIAGEGSYETNEHSLERYLSRICESLQVVEKLAVSQMPREEPPMPPRQAPLDDDGA